MMSDRDRGDERVGQRRRGPQIAQPTNASTRDRDHRRHEPARHGVGHALDRCAAALRLRHHGDDAREHRVGADLVGAHDERSGAVHGAADELVAGLLRATGMDSPVTIDSSTALRPSSTAPSTGTPSPGRTRSRSPTCDVIERDLLVAAVDRIAAGRLRREVEQCADGAAGLLARPQLQHLAEQHENA